MPKTLNEDVFANLAKKHGLNYVTAVHSYESMREVVDALFPPVETDITLMRSTSKGIDGTIANAKHHAEDLMKFITLLRKHAARGFKTWRQGHNVHEFVNVSGTRYTLRPLINKAGQYTGIRLSLRVSKSVEHALFDATELETIPMMLSMMRLLAVGHRGYIRGGTSVTQQE